MKNICICFIGTDKYFNFFENYYETAKMNFLTDCKKTFLLFSDKEYESKNDIIYYKIKHKKWPFITLERFKIINLLKEEIKKHDWFVFVDADMIFNEKINYNDFFNEEKQLFGVQHPGFINKIGTFEFNKNSLACVDFEDDLSTYWQGCLWGGKVENAIKMSEFLEEQIELDLKNNVIAVWHDESHMNKYFIKNKNIVHTLDSGFAYPETMNIPYSKKIIHIHKNNEKCHK